MSVFEKVSPEHPILIQGAMETEIDVLIAAMDNPEFICVDGFEFYRGMIADKAVVVSRTHMAKTNSALATFIGIEKFQPACVINQGTAGAHNISLNIGDIVIGTRILNTDAPDLDIKALLEGKSCISSEPMNVELQEEGVWSWTNYFSSDEELASFFLSTPYNFGTLYEGTIASSDGWTQTKEEVLSLAARYRSDCEEMESFAAAHVCVQKGIPFIALRIISNNTIKGIAFDASTPALCQKFVIDSLFQC